MRLEATLVQGGLAAVGLVLAYTTWQREPEKAPGQVVVLDANKNDVSRVRFEDDKGWVELSRGGDGVWLKLSARGEGKLKTPERELRGNDAAERLMESFTPLRASRALGVVDAAKLKEYGLADEEPAKSPDGGAPPAVAKKIPKRRVEVTVRGEKRSFFVGTSSVSFNPYIRDEGDGRVYLLGASIVSDLESAATRMVERGLHAFKPGDFDGVTVTAGGKKRELVVLNPDSANAAKLASKRSPDKADDQAKNWHDRLWRLYPVDVLGRGEQPATGTPQVVLRVDYGWRGKDKGFFEAGRIAPPAPASTSAPTPLAEVYVRTEHTAGWVHLGGTADDVIKEAEKIAAAQ